MTTNGHIPLASFRILERTEPSLAGLPDLSRSIRESVSGLGVEPEKLRGKRLAVAVGSRGIASLQEIVGAPGVPAQQGDVIQEHVFKVAGAEVVHGNLG